VSDAADKRVIDRTHERAITELLVRICETPAPTFAEAARAALVSALAAEAGLEPRIDEVGNVVVPVPGGRGPRLLLAAHLDTVFPADTDVTVRRAKGRLCAPGIGDNSAGLAVALYYLRTLEAGTCRPRLTFAATVGEEGLGDLRGIRHLLNGGEGTFDLMVALDGHLGTVVGTAVGSKRYRVQVRARGGHSWGDFPAPSAVHAVGEMIHALNRLPLPHQPKTSLNVGEVWGGSGINVIAQEAGFSLDLRSLEPQTLATVEQEAVAYLHKVARRHRVQLELVKVGDRPVAVVDNERLLMAARRALGRLGEDIRVAASSTDANVAMAAGLPAIAFGVFRGGDAHRLDEWLEPASLVVGLRALEGLLCEVV